MSAVAATDAPPAPKGKKKLIIIIAAVLVLVAGGGGAALVLMKKKAHAEGEEAEGGGHDKPAVKAAVKIDPKAVPAFVPLDPFTVNLADRDADRYAQIGITLEVEDAKIGDQIKNYMPAIRNRILMAIADRNAGELLGRDGKALLAERVRRETARALGYEVPDDEAAAPDEDDEDEDKKPKKKKKKPAKKAEVQLPIKAVHFSNFIIQ